jgi:hypothetical protein
LISPQEKLRIMKKRYEWMFNFQSNGAKESLRKKRPMKINPRNQQPLKRFPIK